MKRLAMLAITTTIVLGTNTKMMDSTLKIHLLNEKVETARNLSVAYHPENISEKSNISLDELIYVLENAPKNTLVKYAKYFIQAEELYNINAFALVAIVAQESSWGESKRALEQNNLTGYSIYNSDHKGKSFKSAGDSILATAKLLRNNYLTPGAKNFNGTSISAVNKDYCLTEDSSKTDYNWSKNIHSIAEDLEEIYYDEFR